MFNINNIKPTAKYDTTTYKWSVPGFARPLRIAHLSDLHNASFEWILPELEKYNPDLIAITGDLVNGYDLPYEPNELGLTPMFKSILPFEANIKPFLMRCVSLAPTYVSLGNHEWHASDRDIERFRKIGAIVLDNEWIELEYKFNNQNILLGGLTSQVMMGKRGYYRNHPEMKGYYPIRDRRKRRKRTDPPVLDYEFVDAFAALPGYKILLSHHPEYWAVKEPFLQNRSIDLVLSGHAHGGQIRIGRSNPHSLYAPGQGLFPKYAFGMHRSETSTLIVSRGLSNTVIIPRFGNPPEIVFIELSS
ncbi:MAG: metallophosphoesterase [Lachnospiraceae bacterium]|nr:metallophosphoesterase [Lachnospiraceae bacterium]